MTDNTPKTWRELQEQNSEKFFPVIPEMNTDYIPASSMVGHMNRDYTTVDTGDYGSSKYDSAIGLNELYLLNENRAQQQSALSQITNGLLKGGIITATTFADNFAGTLFGILNLASQSLSGNVNSLSDAFNAFVDNPISRALQEVNNWSEKALPNYYSQEEQDRAWYENVFTANFIGDGFLKNLGFMAGAALSGSATAKALTKFTKLGKARDFYYNLASQQGVSRENATKLMDDIYKSYLNGDDVLGSFDDVNKALVNTAKQAKQADAKIKIAAGLSGSFGESRIEALSNSDRKYDEQYALVEQHANEAIANINNELVRENLDLFHLQPSMDKEGRVTGYETVPNNSPEYQEAYRKKYNDIMQAKEQALAKITEEKIKYANASFASNFAVTGLTNIFILGDAYRGGYKQATAGARNIARNGKFAANNSEEYLKLLKGFSSPVLEGVQEQSQRSITTSLDRWAGKNLNDFYGEAIDEDGIEAASTWFENMAKGAIDTFSDIDSYEDFALGFLTALVPLPGSRITFKDGKAVKERVLGGELYESIREFKEAKAANSATAQALNDIFEDPNFKPLLYNIVREDSNNKIQAEAEETNDKFLFKNAETSKLIDRAITFAEAGRFQDLLEMVNNAYSIESAEDINTLKEMTKIKDSDASIYDGKTDEEIIQYFANKKQEVVKLLNDTKTAYENLYSVYGNSISNVALADMTKLLVTLDDREARIKDIVSKASDSISSLNTEIETVTGEKIPAPVAINNIKDIVRLFQTEEQEKAFSNIIKKYGIEGNTDLKKLLYEEKRRKRAKVLNAQKQIKRLESIPEDTRTEEQNEILNNLKDIVANNKQNVVEVINTVSQVVDKLSLIQSTKNSISEKDLIDLYRLLINRENLVTSLKALSERPEIADERLSASLLTSLKKFTDKVNQVSYEEFKTSKNPLAILNSKIPLSLNTIREKVEKEEDSNEKDLLNTILDYTEEFLGEDSSIQLFDESGNQIKENILLYSRLNDLFRVANSKEELNESVKNLKNDLILNLSLDKELLDSLVDTIVKNINNKNKIKQDDNTTKKNSKKAKTKKMSEEKTSFSELSEAELDEELENLNQEGKTMDDVIKYIKNNDIVHDVLEVAGDLAESLDDFKDMNLEIKDVLPLIKEAWEEINNTKETQEDNDSGNRYFKKGVQEDEFEEEEEEVYEDREDEEFNAEDEYNEEYNEEEEEDSEEDDDIEQREGDVSSDSNPSDMPVRKASKKSKKSVDSADLTVETEIKAPSKKVKNQAEKDLDNSGVIDITDGFHVGRSGAKYNIEQLKNRKGRKAVIAKDEYHYDRDILEYAKAEDFLSKRGLADLLKFIKDNNIEGVRVRVVKMNATVVADERYRDTESTISQRNKEQASSMYVAIEIPKGFENKHGNTMKFNVYNATSSSREQYINMQVLGRITKPYKKENPELYSQYMEMLREFKKEVTNANKNLFRNGETQWPRYVTDIAPDIEYIFSGRIAKDIEDRGLKPGYRSIGDILEESERKELPFQIVVRTSHDTEFVYGKKLPDYSSIGGAIIPLNVHRPVDTFGDNDMHRTGTIWIKTVEANGNVYYKGARLAKFDSNYTSDNSVVAKRIKYALEQIAKAGNTNDKIAIKKAFGILRTYLYMPKGKKMYYNPNTHTIRRTGIEVSLDNIEQAYQELKKAGYKFNLGLDDSLTLKNIIDSNIVETDLASLHNVNASVVISGIRRSETGTLVAQPSEQIRKFKEASTIHMGNKNFQEGLSYSSEIKFGKDSYKMDSLGKVHMLNPDTGILEPLEDSVKSLAIKAFYSIKNGDKSIKEQNRFGYLNTEEGKKIIYKISISNGTGMNPTVYYISEDGVILNKEDLTNLEVYKDKSLNEKKRAKSKKALEDVLLGKTTEEEPQEKGGFKYSPESPVKKPAKKETKTPVEEVKKKNIRRSRNSKTPIAIDPMVSSSGEVGTSETNTNNVSKIIEFFAVNDNILNNTLSILTTSDSNLNSLESIKGLLNTAQTEGGNNAIKSIINTIDEINTAMVKFDLDKINEKTNELAEQIKALLCFASPF